MGDIEYGKKKGKKENILPPEPILQRDVFVGTCPTHGQVKVWVEEERSTNIEFCPIPIGIFKTEKVYCPNSLSLRLVRKPHHVSAA